jgi:hypothetical protein
MTATCTACPTGYWKSTTDGATSCTNTCTTTCAAGQTLLAACTASSDRTCTAVHLIFPPLFLSHSVVTSTFALVHGEYLQDHDGLQRLHGNLCSLFRPALSFFCVTSGVHCNMWCWLEAYALCGWRRVNDRHLHCMSHRLLERHNRRRHLVHQHLHDNLCCGPTASCRLYSFF